MTLHGRLDFYCPTPGCGYELPNHRAEWVAIPPEQREYSWDTERMLTPCCPTCAAPLERRPPCSTRHDLLSESFVIDGETIGRGPGDVRISSLSEVRAIEQESERRHRNKDGQIVNFRVFSQDQNNRERNAFEGSSYQTGKSRRPDRRSTLSNLPIAVRPVRS